MSRLQEWLSTRLPELPEPLSLALLEGELGRVGSVDADALAQAGRAHLDRARERLGRVRESAFHLLTADALFTYACEAALDHDDPESTLLEIVELSSGR